MVRTAVEASLKYSHPPRDAHTLPPPPAYPLCSLSYQSTETPIGAPADIHADAHSDADADTDLQNLDTPYSKKINQEKGKVNGKNEKKDNGKNKDKEDKEKKEKKEKDKKKGDKKKRDKHREKVSIDEQAVLLSNLKTTRQKLSVVARASDSPATRPVLTAV